MGAAWILLMSCGGGSTTDRALQPPAGAGGASGGESGDVQSESCEAVWQRGVEVLNSAVADAPKACSVDDECRLYEVGANCVHVCGFEIAVTDATTVQRAMEEVNTTICTDACVPNPSPTCGGGRDPQTAKCVSGECAAVAE